MTQPVATALFGVCIPAASTLLPTTRQELADIAASVPDTAIAAHLLHDLTLDMAAKRSIVTLGMRLEAWLTAGDFFHLSGDKALGFLSKLSDTQQAQVANHVLHVLVGGGGNFNLLPAPDTAPSPELAKLLASGVSLPPAPTQVPKQMVAKLATLGYANITLGLASPQYRAQEAASRNHPLPCGIWGSEGLRLTCEVNPL
ncbi:MAG: hypothetical protein WAX89_06110 [Alphaproteobacteria bacterium]